ncbi:MAG: ATP-binding protein [Clostridia bacterium]|nr:ATP-binding protein [Clostridia bacterium]
MTREEAIHKITEEYQNIQTREINRLRARENEAVKIDPEIGRLLSLRASLPMKSMRLAMEDKAHAQEIAQTMRETGLRINAEIRSRLVSASLPEDYLKLHYECPVCRDTGYTDGVPQKMCQCFTKRIRVLTREDEGLEALKKQNFSTYDENRIPDAPVTPGGATQREITGRIRELCEEYADQFPNTFKPNLMLLGEAGLGKSFFLSAICERVESRGFEATLINAYKLLEIMRERHFHIEGGEGDFERLLSCPLLLIDDLGCEPMLRNITQEYLFILINDRMTKGLHTVIATNLTPPAIKERYGERIMSRLCDKTVSDSVRLVGKDLRRI